MSGHEPDEGQRFADEVIGRCVLDQFGTSAKKPRGLAAKTLALRRAILDVLGAMDKPVTVRQVFYQLTVAGAVPKTEAQGYRPVQRQLVEMRRGRLIPYDWIADHTRWMRKPITYAGLSDFFDRSARFFRQDLWIDSHAYLEIWIEKDALAGTVLPVTTDYDVPLMVARGFASESFLYSTAESIVVADKPAYVYHLGDFDPSGWAASADIESRLTDMVDRLDGDPEHVTFARLAVHPEQIREWNLPSRPTKESDTRCRRFYAEHGEGVESVELDAVHPDRLRALVREAIEQHVDPYRLAQLRAEEAAARETLAALSAREETDA